MSKEITKPLAVLLSAIVLLYIIHKTVFAFGHFSSIDFKYSIEQLYGFFTLFSVTIVLVLIKVREKNLDIVGNTFLLITSVKMAICYLLGRPIIKQENLDNSIEKWNFFTLFIVFLLFETAFTIYLLNTKSNKKEE